MVQSQTEYYMTKSKGKIKFFNTLKGFGFIAHDGGSKDAFVHISQLQGDSDSFQEGQEVEFELVQGKKGPEAQNVTRN
jgi:CspA family cold shock protein